MKHIQLAIGRSIVGLTLIFSVSTSVAAILTYYDKAAWLAAAGAISGSEDFSSFSSDTSFRKADGPLALNGLSIHQRIYQPADFQGDPSANIVDVSPFQSNSVDGTAYAYVSVDVHGGAGVTSGVSLVFDSPIRAWGADFRNVDVGTWSVPNTQEGLRVSAWNPGACNQGCLVFDDSVIPPSSGSPFFFGLVADGDDVMREVTFRTSIDSEPNSEEFSMDNIVFVAVPEPGTLALLALGLAGLGYSRRKQ